MSTLEQQHGSEEAVRKVGANALYALGHQLLATDRTRDAADVFRLMLCTFPDDERSWLGLGTCHERLEQPAIAKELYGTGRLLARSAGRCHIAFARVARELDAPSDLIDEAIDAAAAIADSSNDDALSQLVAWERSRAS